MENNVYLIPPILICCSHLFFSFLIVHNNLAQYDSPVSPSPGIFFSKGCWQHSGIYFDTEYFNLNEQNSSDKFFYFW